MSNETGAVVIAEGTEYELLSSGDGAAFVLRFKTDQLTAYLQGDDAIRFRADYEALKMQYPAWQADQTLAQLWDQGGYSWLAEQDGC
ncbi:MAG: hypothetical protein ABSD11_14275 [Methylocella sp.]|jgi:hypothetical protein